MSRNTVLTSKDLVLSKARCNGLILAYGVVVSMFDFHRSDWGSNPGHGGKIS